MGTRKNIIALVIFLSTLQVGLSLFDPISVMIFFGTLLSIRQPLKILKIILTLIQLEISSCSYTIL